ncbi:MAG TPA: glycoside hydrolase family 18 protein [Patescibacteria group bacterium]|nr:glycoside hydrolase family 18 protein [Patescibacteria group bacterium]
MTKILSNLNAIKNDRISRWLLTISACIVLSVIFGLSFLDVKMISPLGAKKTAEAPQKKSQYEVFGFAPYWTIGKLENVDFNVLTTLAYFGVPVNPDGTLDKTNVGYQKFESEDATTLFNKAHSYGTRVVLTLTQMDNDSIMEFLDDSNAQRLAIKNSVKLVKDRNIDGINVDFEYVGDPGDEYRAKFTKFVGSLEASLHKSISNSNLSVSVYATSAKMPKLYDITSLSKNSDSIFMMAYDFATSGSSNAIPTAPLYGYKEGKYWYDISTAVDDFLAKMPANKLILGLPWYGYNYPVSQPEIKAAKYQGYSYYYWYNRKRYLAQFLPTANAQTYESAIDTIKAEKTGWDDIGKVSWMAYQEDGIWRMIFLDDSKSLKIKYDFAKDKKLGGVGIWALGFDSGKNELWSLLSDEFGVELAKAN